MKLLLDSHTFIWWTSEPTKLSKRALELCTDPANSLLLSIASIWEIQIKRQLGKLSLTMPLADIVRQQQTNGTVLLPVNRNTFTSSSPCRLFIAIRSTGFWLRKPRSKC